MLTPLIQALATPAGAAAGLLAVVLLGVLTIMAGRLVPKASLLREVAAERRRADGWEKVAGVLLDSLPRIVRSQEQLDAYIRQMHALPLSAIQPDAGVAAIEGQRADR